MVQDLHHQATAHNTHQVAAKLAQQAAVVDTRNQAKQVTSNIPKRIPTNRTLTSTERRKITTRMKMIREVRVGRVSTVLREAHGVEVQAIRYLTSGH